MIVGIRGLDSLQDAVTAIDASPVPLLDGRCHRGAMRASEWVLGRVWKHVIRHQPKEIQVLGHSLGGAVAACIAVAVGADPSSGLEGRPPGCRVAALAVGCPPCFSYGGRLRAAAEALVTTWVNGCDAVPYLSEANVDSLLDKGVGGHRRAGGVPAAQTAAPLPPEHRQSLLCHSVFPCKPEP
uniref:Fungal lipase-type domain-containing protein n=1 Tax=Tetraselmis sp. GSL018 TaxID=582737 RepID=A0A061SL76_9CHLO